MSTIQAIREKIIQELPLWDQPSISVGVVKEGEVILAEGFGYADQEKNLKANQETLYQIGSCSKAFTAAAAALLVDQGKLEWDRPVHEYLPWLEFKDPYTTAHATVRDLLCHRTGLPRHDAYWINGPCSRREMVENLRNMEPVWFIPFALVLSEHLLCGGGHADRGIIRHELGGVHPEEPVGTAGDASYDFLCRRHSKG